MILPFNYKPVLRKFLVFERQQQQSMYTIFSLPQITITSSHQGRYKISIFFTAIYISMTRSSKSPIFGCMYMLTHLIVNLIWYKTFFYYYYLMSFFKFISSSPVFDIRFESKLFLFADSSLLKSLCHLM